MGKNKLRKSKVNAKQSWAKWLLVHKKSLTLKNKQTQDSNFIPHDHESQGFSGIPGPHSPGIIPRTSRKSTKHQKTPQ